LVLSDLRLPGADGLELLAKVRTLAPPQPALIIITAFGTVPQAVEALKLRAEVNLFREDLCYRLETFQLPVPPPCGSGATTWICSAPASSSCSTATAGGGRGGESPPPPRSWKSADAPSTAALNPDLSPGGAAAWNRRPCC